jgi:DNA-binding response OmpR family regulator
MKILLIENNRETAFAIKHALKDFYIIEHAYSGKDGEYLAIANIYDFFIIDYKLPDIDGISVCKEIRSAGIVSPILILTETIELQNKIAALKNGADDCITKPCSIEELRARIEALMRRASQANSSCVLSVGDLTLDLYQRRVFRGGKPIRLKRKEFDLLEYLMRNAGRVVTRSMIIDHVWDSATDSVTNIVDVHIKYLRDSIDREFEKKLIKTVHGCGYKIES